MPLSGGTKLGPYRLEAPIGAGGMGEVYRAKDTRLDRTVAIKVLAAHTAADPNFRQRFEREAKTISSLDHPHICTLYDVGHETLPAASSEAGAAGAVVDYLVMQFLEGESLADRLARAAQPKSDPGSRPASGAGTGMSMARGPIPLDQTLRHAAQIAEALDAAHRHGIVHRDLKPGNVMLTKSGVKLLDFGLAKLREQPAPAGGFSVADTRSAITGEGTLLGTLQYMSPEQLEGREVDARSDIFAFGAMLVEMLTGQRAFEGKSQAGVIAAILEGDTPAVTDLADVKSSLSGVARRGLDRLLRKCLAKDPDERWQCAADLADELKWIEEERLRGAGQPEEEAVPAAAQPVAPAPASRRRLWIGVAAGVGLVAIGIAAWTFLRPTTQPEPVRFVVLPPDKQPFAGWGPGFLSVSPDGRRLAFVTETDNRLLWIRPLGSLAAQLLPGTEGAWHPFWSPDGRFVAFVTYGATGSKLKKIDVSGGTPLTLADTNGTRGAWSRQGAILFGGPDNRLYRIPESGGQPTAVTELDKARQEIEHVWPAFLPDGRRFIFLARTSDASKNALYLASLDSPARTHLVDVKSSVDYAAGHLLYQRDGTLKAQPFDEKTGHLKGDAAPVLENVNYNPDNGRAAFSVSATGVLAYRTGQSAGSSTLTWFDRTGKTQGKISDVGTHRWPRLSPDGRRLIVGRLDEQRKSDLWLIDLDRGVPTRFTFDPADDRWPVWSPDGAFVVFCSNRKGVSDLYQRSSGGAAADELLYESPEDKVPTGFSPDGKILLFHRFMGKGKGVDIWALPMTGDRKPFPVVATPFNEGFAAFSPDGRWIAYDSDDSGAAQVYVQPFPPTGVKVRLSTTSGEAPAWSADGKRIFYSTSDNHMMVVDVTTSRGELRAGLPQELFVQPRSGGSRHFAVDPSGQRFLMPVSSEEQAATPITVVLNWASGLEKK